MKNETYDSVARMVQDSLDSLSVLNDHIRLKKKMGMTTAEDENTYTRLKTTVGKQVTGLESEGYTFDKHNITL